VTTAPLSSPSADSVKDQVKKLKDESRKNADTSNASLNLTPEAKTPTWMLAVMAVLVIGILTAILILWRKSTAMAAERTRLEESFRNEQRLFEDFAQQNPDTLAQELNQLFGAPAAGEHRAY
jgi:hypothetical protein